MLAALIIVAFAFAVNAQDTPAPTPEPQKPDECAELRNTLEAGAAETWQIRLTLGFLNNSGYWNSAAEELSFSIARRQIARNLQAIAFKLGVKRVKDWDIVPMAERLAYQQTVSRALDRERDKSMTADQTAMNARLAEIAAQEKGLKLKLRDLGCSEPWEN